MYNHRKTTLTTAVDNCCCRCMIRTDLDSCTYMCSKCAPSATRLLVNTGSRQLSINIQITSFSSSSVSSPSYVVTCEEDDRKRLHVACRRCVSQGGFDQGGLGLRCITRKQLTNVWSTSVSTSNLPAVTPLVEYANKVSILPARLSLKHYLTTPLLT